MGAFNSMPTSQRPQGGFQMPEEQAQRRAPTAAAQPYGGADPYAGMRFQQGYTGGPTRAPTGWDFSSPGVGEQWFNAAQTAYATPGQASQYWGGVQGQLAQPGAAEGYWQRNQGLLAGPTRSEQLAQDPGLGAYYDRAKERAGADINNQLAARGGFGSSAGMGLVGEAMTDLEAQRANREADYARAVAGQADQMRMQQLGLGGQLAGQAQADAMRRLGLGGQLAGAADSSDLARLNAGMAAASQAQGLRRQRGRDYMGDVFAPSQLQAGILGQGMEGMLAGDQALMESALAMALGIPREGLNQDYLNQAQHREDIGMVMDIIGSIYGMGGA